MKHNWEYKRLGDVCLLKVGGDKPFEISETKTTDKPIPIYSNGIENEGIYGYCSSPTVLEQAVTISGRGTIGVPFIRREPFVPIVRLIVAIPRESVCLDYFYYWILNRKFSGKGVAIPQLTVPMIINEAIPVPPLEVQRQIVAELDKINEVMEDCRALQRNLDTLAQSLFYNFFGDPIANPKGWEMKNLGAISKVLGGSTPKTDKEEYWNGDLCWVTPAELRGQKYIYDTERHITELGRATSGLQLFPINTVLLTSRAPIGKVAIVKTPMYCNQGFKNLICNKNQVHYQYVYFYLSLITDILNTKGSGATFKEISKRVTEEVSIPVPPLPLQEKFAARIEQIDAQKKSIEQTIAELQTLLNSRMDYWFN